MNIRTLLILGTLLFNYAAYASICGDAYESPIKRAVRPFTRLRESIPLAQSRLGFASYSEPRFNVRVVASGAPDFSPLGLQTLAKDRAASILNEFSLMGFTQRSFLQIVLEAKENTLKRIVQDEDGELSIETIDGESPWLTTASSLILLPSRLSGYKLFEGEWGKRGFEALPLLLLVPARDAHLHWLSEKFMMAHEIAHATENAQSHRSLIWLEARADMLAFLATGIHQLAPRGGFEMQVYNRAKGELELTNLDVVRDLSRPRIMTRSEIVPLIGIYHQNSEFISGLLFKLKAQQGEAAVIDFIKWMDQTTANPIPELRPLELDSEKRPNVIYVDPGDKETSAAEVMKEVDAILGLLHEWAEAKKVPGDFVQRAAWRKVDGHLFTPSAPPS